MVARARGGDLMPELGYRPVNKYLPPRAGGCRATRRPPRRAPRTRPLPRRPADRLLRWVDRLLSR